MTSSAPPPHQAFVWIWLPGKTTPVVAGRIHAEGRHFVFTYGRSYLAREDAIPVYAPELSLHPGVILPEPPLEMANALRDASPDAWGRRVIIHRLAGGRGGADDMVDLDELTFTPAYDICPQSRTGREASQAMRIGRSNGAASCRCALQQRTGFFFPMTTLWPS